MIMHKSQTTNTRQKLLLVFACLSLWVTFTAPTHADDTYADADLLLSSVLNHMQYPIPAARIAETSDHYLNFKDAVPTPATPWKDEVRYVAAYSFCQRLVPKFPAPPHTSTTQETTADIVALTDNMNNVAARSAALEECLAAVSYRTACPANNPNIAAVGATPSCHDMQARMCNYLKKPPGAGGLGIDRITPDGSDEADKALIDCDQWGLSPAMYDKILAHRCDSEKYVKNLPAILNGKSSLIELTVQFECQHAKDAFEAKMDREREGILIAIQTLFQMRGLGQEVNQSAKPVGP